MTTQSILFDPAPSRPIWRRLRRLARLAVAPACRLTVAAVFIIASIPKIMAPHDFAASVYQYRIVPENLVNIAAVFLPWIELVAALCLVFIPKLRMGATSLIVTMLAVFCLAQLSVVVRGIDAQCGCFSAGGQSGRAGWLGIARNCVLILVTLLPWLLIKRARAGAMVPPPGAAMATLAFLLLAAPAVAATPPNDSQERIAQLRREVEAADRRVESLVGTRHGLLREKRADVVRQTIPIVTELAHSLSQLGQLEVDSNVKIQKLLVLATLAVHSDEPASAALQDATQSSDPQEAVTAAMSRLVVEWVRAAGREAVQLDLLDELMSCIRTDPGNQAFDLCLVLMHQYGSPGPITRQRLARIAANGAGVARGGPDAGRLELFKTQRRLKGNPLNLTGVDLSGAKVSTEQWKGRVVLVEFWASWCAPCAAELPKLKALHEKYHSKGLQIVGVSLDTDREDLDRFLVQHPGIDWPQLLDGNGRSARGLVRECGVTAIPQIFLVDKRGVLRSIYCRQGLEEAVASLLEE